MGKEIKQVKRICRCAKCGNEAEMTVTCTLDSVDEELPEKDPSLVSGEKPVDIHKHVKGTGTCSHCGNEAEMWVDL